MHTEYLKFENHVMLEFLSMHVTTGSILCRQ
jgi:hypothetical protein